MALPSSPSNEFEATGTKFAFADCVAVVGLAVRPEVSGKGVSRDKRGL